MNPDYRIGCPVFAFAGWRGNLFPADARADRFLHHYARVFRCVEGNSTFYGLPSAETVARWCDQAPQDFRFSFKVPREITHDRGLVDADVPMRIFLKRIAPLGARGGPLLLQLGPSFGATQLPALKNFLATLSSEQGCAVEVRHPDFFASGAAEDDLHELLKRAGVERACFDTTTIHGLSPQDSSTQLAQTRKPRLPRRAVALGLQPLIRIVGENAQRQAPGLIDFWAQQLAQWMQQGRTPMVFTHTPDDFYCPAFANQLNEAVRALLPTMPALQIAAEAPQQGALF